jgi:hypothetical protein
MLDLDEEDNNASQKGKPAKPRGMGSLKIEKGIRRINKKSSLGIQSKVPNKKCLHVSNRIAEPSPPAIEAPHQQIFLNDVWKLLRIQISKILVIIN